MNTSTGDTNPTDTGDTNTGSTPPTGTWELDPDSTTVTVTVKKMKAITVPASLTVTDGSITIADGQVASVDVTVDAASYASPNAKRNEHVVGPDFLDADDHPTITFAASGPAAGSSEISGQATVKGRRAPLTFAVSDLDVQADTASFTATATADRFDLGVDKMPAFVIAKQLDIAVTANARRRA